MNKHLLLLVLALNLPGLTGKGQTPVGSNVIFPSPNVATLQRFVDYPVNYSTGMAQVSIPLYNINLRGYSFPVSINNHASGVMAGHNYSPLGIGWALMATGYVSREIHARPDEQCAALETTRLNLDNTYSSTFGGTYDRLLMDDTSIPLGSANGYSTGPLSGSSPEDPEHDIFTFNVNGLSGKFIMNSGGTAPQLLTTNSDITISGTIGPGGTPSGGFTITDTKGITYKFGQSGSYGATEMVKISEATTYSGTTAWVNSSWFLSEIDTPSGNLYFSYGTINTETADPTHGMVGNTTYQYQATYGYSDWYNGTTPLGEMADYYSSLQGPHTTLGGGGSNYLTSYLTGITFPTGSIGFNYDWYFGLSSCVVNDNNISQIKKINFTYHNGAGGGRGPNNSSALLQTMQVLGVVGSNPETYNFKYYGTQTDGITPLSDPSNGKDWWGYSNGGTYTSPPSDPSTSYPDYTGCPGCRAANGSKAGMLQTIIYPTGGNTTFDYESNYYLDGSATLYGPGLRIKSIVTDDGSGANMITKTYKYGDVIHGETGFGTLFARPRVSDFYTQQIHVAVGTNSLTGNPQIFGSFTLRTYTADPVEGMQDAYRQPMYYSLVTEYVNSPTDNNGKTVYIYSIPNPSPYNGGSYFRLQDWTGSKLKAKYVYKYQSGTYVKVSSSAMDYTTIRNAQVNQIKLFRNTVVNYDNNTLDRPMEWMMLTSPTGIDNFTISGIYDYVDWPVESAVELPYHKIDTVFNSEGNVAVATTTIYHYDSANHIQPTSVTTTTSRGDYLLTENTYPRDLNPGSTIVENPLESRTYREDDLSGTNKRLVSSNYTQWVWPDYPSSIYSIESATPLTDFHNLSASSGTGLTNIGGNYADSRYVEKKVFNYNGLTPTEQYQVNNSHTSYLWGYGGQYPIAKIENANYSTVTSVLGSTTLPAYPTDQQVHDYLAPLRTSSSLSGALITTYTYKNMIGMTSMTDPKGEITYYTYDNSNRLQAIWDHNKHLLKSYCYNYQNQLTGCPVIYPPGQVFVRFEHGSTSTGSTGDGSGGTITTTTEDMVVHFYSDAACTQPLVLTSAITVELDDYYYIFDALTDYGSDGSEVYGTYTISPGSSTYDIGTITTHVDHYYYDSYEDYLDDTQDYTYYPNYVSGSTYILE